MEKNIKIKIPEGYNDAVFDKETNEIKFIKNSKLGDKVTIDGVEGYVLEVDKEGEPTVLCSEIIGDLTWDDAMKEANKSPWHLPTDEEFKKYYKIIRKLDDDWHLYWTSTEDDSLYARYINTGNGIVGTFYTKTSAFYIRAFAYVGSKKDSKPRSWEEYRKQVYNTPSFVAIIESSYGCFIDRNRGETPLISEFNTEKEAKAVVALCKLIQLRDAWWGDWKPDWRDNGTRKFIIFCEKGVPVKSYNYTYQRTLAFPTEKMCDEFLDTFRDLIEEAKTLI